MASRENSPAYIIIGAPRSGTSALTLIFKEQGIPMYLSADKPDIDSPSGNQEDNLVRLLNNFLMGENGLGNRRNWDNPKYISLNQTTSQHIQLIKKYINSREHNAGERGWGVKDPRMSFLIEPWSLATQGHSVNWIYIRRENREASIRSLIKMLPAKVRYSGDPDSIYRLVSNWLEAFHIASELGFHKSNLNPYCITYESLFNKNGLDELSRKYNFKNEITCINPQFNRQGNKYAKEV